MYGARLKSARLKKKMTLMQVGIRLNTTHATLSRYESEKLEPSIDTLRDLCDLYGVSADWVIGTKYGK